MISTARELREIGRELNLTVGALSRADITVKKYNLTSSYGEPGRTLSKSVTLAGMRSLAGSNNQEFIKKYAGEDTDGVFQITFAAADQPGFWEERGYSNTAIPWFDDRFSHG